MEQGMVVQTTHAYKTSELWVAAFLKARGHQLLSAKLGGIDRFIEQTRVASNAQAAGCGAGKP